ncbi:protein of unassigned function [Methylobacterium oryzae CBMB20]|uniref:Protein of unassigned function n=1 Tax=Methylobacterium oryzae CBMB20 TaxID=693986 RepID=A0A089NLC1_9HYPH|nr:protein of unassigned function [Methylobacterium oryzae CBMB20]
MIIGTAQFLPVDAAAARRRPTRLASDRLTEEIGPGGGS